MSQLSLNSLQDKKYAAVNTALNDYFFDGRFEMQPVYLDLEHDAKSELVSAIGINFNKLEDFIGLCVAHSLQFDKANPYSRQEKWLKEWSKTDRKTPPPFTALLCALSIAANKMGADENFSHNNYYKRLFELLEVKDLTTQRKLSHHGKNTQKFWKALNLWLIENDFMLGCPTAKVLISHWKYVSYALSQALVRDADRKKFVDLFETHHLLPNEPVSETEMALLIHDWMTINDSTGPTKWLRKLWATRNIRDRVITAAIDTLKTWENPTQVFSEVPRNAQFQWLLGFVPSPREQVHLLLSVIHGGQEEPLLSNASAHTKTELYLEEGNDPDIYLLGPNEFIDLDLLLLQSKEFIGKKSGTSYKYIAKPIVPLIQSSDSPFYKEIPRVRLFEEHAILCHTTWLKKIKEHLLKCAVHQNYTVLGPSDMQGIPNDWHILRRVEIARSDENTNDNLYALNPIDDGNAIVCVNGLDLGHNTWHVDARPTLKATTEKPDYKFEVVREQFDEVEKTLVSCEVTNGFIEVTINSLEIAPRTSLRAVIKKPKGKIVKETSFSLIGADIPRRLSKKRIFHPFVEDKKFSLETNHVRPGNQNGLEGCFIHGDSGRLNTKVENAFVDKQNEIPKGVPETSPEVKWQSSEDAAQRAPKSCVIRGCHLWVYEAYEKGDDIFNAKRAECKSCHAKTISRSREEAKSIWKKIYQPDQPVIKENEEKIEEPSEIDKIKTDSSGNTLVSSDIIYDSLCYLGQGTWKEFQRIVSRASQNLWFSHSFANDLFVLGHLELQTAFYSTASDWSVPPPVFVVGANNGGYLAGFHSKTLLESIDAALIPEGAHRKSTSTPEQVIVHRWIGLSELNVEELLKDVKDPHGRPVKVTRGLDSVIASKLPTLDEIWECGEPIYIEKLDNLVKFDVHQARWIRVDTLQDTGAYKVGLHGTRYVYRDSNGNTRQVGYRAAKILAARAKNTQLHKYDPTTGQFTATLGVDPPGLFARALVVSSGMLPKIDNGKLIYTSVNPIVATLILNKMYGKEMNFG